MQQEMWYEAHRVSPEGDQLQRPLMKITPEEAEDWQVALNESRTPEDVARGVVFQVKLTPMPV